ncbi:hypothetical protein PTE30175_00254 [Pandoraea terrae]|uniref:Uncharacterized protein n=1 Tax=Pandoraea terrae TaxID=1537710 RepID=A0A5E4RP38_9BURK|nr:hypothetical protein PTE30175_00254 [Pandoraea terrae]
MPFAKGRYGSRLWNWTRFGRITQLGDVAELSLAVRRMIHALVMSRVENASLAAL